MVGLLGRVISVISSSQGLYPPAGQHEQRTNAHSAIHALSWIGTHDPSVRASEESSCLRPRGHRDRPWASCTCMYWRGKELLELHTRIHIPWTILIALHMSTLKYYQYRKDNGKRALIRPWPTSLFKFTAVPLLRRLVVGFPPQQSGFNPRSIRVRFAVDKATKWQVFIKHFCLPCLFHFTSCSIIISYSILSILTASLINQLKTSYVHATSWCFTVRCYSNPKLRKFGASNSQLRSLLCAYTYCDVSSILETRKHYVSETWSISVLRLGEETPTLLGPLERANLNHWATPVRFTTSI
jgi:hypothetical protein